jgi:hypothetical protein
VEVEVEAGPASVVATPPDARADPTVCGAVDAPLDAGAVAARTPMMPTIPATLSPADTVRLSEAAWRRPVPVGRASRVSRGIRARRKRGIPAWIGISGPRP